MMLKRLLVYIVITVLATACYKYDKPKKPKNLIPKDKMVDIIMDIRLISSANGKNKTILENNNLQPETYIYKKYNIDSLQFALSNNYYAYYVEDYEAIYAKVKDSFEILKSNLDKLITEEEKRKKKKDSLESILKQESNGVFKKRDSIKRLRIKDSLDLIREVDSLTEIELENTFEEGLIKPVSDKGIQ